MFPDNLLQWDMMGLEEQGQMPDWSWGHRAGLGERVLGNPVKQDLLPTLPRPLLSMLEVVTNTESGPVPPELKQTM